MEAKIIGKRVMLPKLIIACGERGADKIEFEYPESYEGISLAGLTPYALIVRSDGTTDKIPLGTGDGKVTLDIGASVTAVAGTVEARVSFESADGNVVYMTEKFFLEVDEATDVYEDFTERAPSALYELEQEMKAHVEEFERTTEELKGLLGGDFHIDASMVGGLADVAKSGAYSDLTGAPDLTEYVKKSEMGSVGGGGGGSKGVVLKYASYSDELDTMFAITDENCEKMVSYRAAGDMSAGIVMSKTDSSGQEIIYPMKKLTDTGKQWNMLFDIEGTDYIGVYNYTRNLYTFIEN